MLVVQYERDFYNSAIYIYPPISPPDSPFIVSPPSNTEAGAGQLVTFTCVAVGPPEPAISWRRLDSSLQNDSVQSDGTLWIFSVTVEDNGRYECNATNAHGWRVAAANLTVLGEPSCL